MNNLDEFDEIFNMEMAKEMGITAGAGGAALLLAIFGTATLAGFTKWYSGPLGLPLLSGTFIVTGAVAGRALYNVNHDAAMGVVGAVSGYGLASLIKTIFALDVVHPV